jgi:hypothetical protein
VRSRAALSVLVAVVLASTALNLAIMYERLAPLRAQVEALPRTSPDATAVHARLTAVAQSELSRAIAMELSTLVLGFVVFTRLKRRPVS